MKKKQFLILLAFLTGTAGQAQLRVQDKGLLFLEGGAVLTVQGDIDSKADVLGSGVLLLNGTSLQRINMNGFLVSNLQVDNRAGVALESDVRIGSQLLLNAGKMSMNAATLSLASGAGVTG